jgi:hypothetical protein
MTEQEYIVVSDLQRFRTAYRLLADCTSKFPADHLLVRLGAAIEMQEEYVQGLMQYPPDA